MPIPKPATDFILTRQLTRTMTAPTRVVPGQPLTFTVTFADPEVNGSGIDDSPCPIFEMHIRGAAVGGTYLLPCIPIISIDPGKAVAFTMRLAVRPDAMPGPATLVWQLLEPAGRALTASVRIA